MNCSTTKAVDLPEGAKVPVKLQHRYVPGIGPLKATATVYNGKLLLCVQDDTGGFWLNACLDVAKATVGAEEDEAEPVA